MKRLFFVWLVKIGLLVILAGCSGVNFSQWRFPYMYTVEQGNYINQKQLNELKIGMTKEQVVFLLGNPVSQFMFNQQNWQLIYQEHVNGNLKKNYIINLDFDTNDRLLTIYMAGKVFEK